MLLVYNIFTFFSYFDIIKVMIITDILVHFEFIFGSNWMKTVIYTNNNNNNNNNNNDNNNYDNYNNNNNNHNNHHHP